MGGDNLFQRDEAFAVGHDHEPGQQGRDLDPGDALLAGDGIPDADDQVERQVRDVGERMAGVDGQRRQDGEDLSLKDVDQVVAVVVVERRPVRQSDAGRRQLGCDLVHEDMRLPGHELRHPGTDGPQRVARAQAVCGPGPQPGVDLVLQTGHAHLEELVEALGEDGQELDPFEQGRQSVFGQRRAGAPRTRATRAPGW